MDNLKTHKDHIVLAFGGTNVVAEICNVTPSAVSQWDRVPSKHLPALLMAARARKIKINANDLIYQGAVMQ